MKTIFYKKEGRRYVPAYEYDQELMDALPKGDHLVMVYPGGSSRRYNINPAYAPMIAAGRVAEHAMIKTIQEASEIRREENSETPLTAEQKAAWEHLVEVFGERARYLRWPSAHDVAEAGIKAMTAEADELLKHPAVQAAYEHFLLTCELCKEHK